MRKPSLGDLAHIAEIIAAIGVIVSLIYVGFEISANTAAVRSNSVQAITNTSVESLQALNADPGLARLRRIGDADLSMLDEDEVWRYQLYYRQYWLSFQNVYFQRELEVIGDDLWASYQRVLCATIVNPGVRANWPSHADILDPGFVSVVEECSGM